MQKARLVILIVAVAAAGAAGYIATRMKPTTVVVESAQPQIKLQDVLVATENLGVGAEMTGQMRWQAWPEDAIADGYIKRADRPKAEEELRGSTVRLQIFPGEPIREAKLIGKGQSFMSAQLPAGMRAVATQIAAETSAGGFILPDDYVDVIMIRQMEGEQKQYATETILSNIRVLAIDQTIQEDETGQKTKVGSTATLELTPEQAEILTVAQQMASRLSLVLRSVQDAQEQTGPGAEYLVNSPGRAGNVKLIKSGTVTEILGRK
ncbi:Flp pilus assembly protein CpaB [Phyllobacterium zundukense]|uniref:Flp pilus assembly protein CpaB n=1 Tax=Phyllobacterium zundukense TaxID=1867719 RepID=A0A2N9VSI2_9HYPH|nr:Flp pilus assembly protein CpaB [Phyllobacterium zundukense]ATU92868.1 Flp pilus assembly protein CpaB [Phyllobacterium zundukense]PIO42450.1 Flp pilus assembly protein CpaB [Phyllobacterium zundukense]